MKRWGTIGLCLGISLLSNPLFSYWKDLSYKADTQEHKRDFLQWISRHGLWNQYGRIILTLSCPDADEIPKHPDAGKVFERERIPYQLMHNGIKVVKDGYCAAWMTDLIYGLKGHHEPQEERVFHEVLKSIPSHAVMIELGSYWAYYSLWFATHITDPVNYMVEPDPDRLDLGRQNFELNHKKGTFIHGYIGSCNADAGDFRNARQLFIDSFLDEHHIDHVNILHSDIQASEFEMLKTAQRSIEQKKIDYFFISTHTDQIHRDCIQFLREHDYVILAEHTPSESYSVDGLVVGKRRGVEGPESVNISKNH